MPLPRIRPCCQCHRRHDRCEWRQSHSLIGTRRAIGAHIRRVSSLKELKQKTTQSGLMAVVTFSHELFVRKHMVPALTETQTYVLFGQPGRTEAPTPNPIPTGGRRTKMVIPGETLFVSVFGTRLQLSQKSHRQSHRTGTFLVNGVQKSAALHCRRKPPPWHSLSRRARSSELLPPR